MIALALVSLMTMGYSGVMAAAMLFAIEPSPSLYPGIFVAVLFWPMAAAFIPGVRQRFHRLVVALQYLLLLGNLLFWAAWISENHGF